MSRYQKGKTGVDLHCKCGRRWCGLGMKWHQLDHMQTICTSLQTDNHTSTSSLNFYRPGALRDAQRTVSKHWSQIHTVLVLKSENSWSRFFLHDHGKCCMLQPHLTERMQGSKERLYRAESLDEIMQILKQLGMLREVRYLLTLLQ